MSPPAAPGVPAGPAGSPAGVDRLEGTRVVLDATAAPGGPPALIVASIGNPAFDLYLAGDRPEHWYLWGAMGLAASVGLGLALARPERRVVVLDGDGAILMNLGALATAAALAPPNLIHVIWDNAQYEVTGGQPTATAGPTDLVRVARGAGIRRARRVSSLAALRDAVRKAMRQPGPWVLVVPTRPAPPDRPRPLAALRERFLDLGAFRRAAALASVNGNARNEGAR